MGALAAAGWGAFGASSLLLGAWLALHWRPSARTVGLIMGFGAGALLGAVAYELIPPGSLAGNGSFAAFATGALVFFTADRAVTRRHRAGAGAGAGAGAADVSRSIVLGALLDGIPESLVLGMSLAAGGKVSVAFLTAVFVSNLPEALGATSGMRGAGQEPQRVYLMWTWIAAASSACAALGYVLLQVFPEASGAYVQAFAAGAVLTMLVNSMIPEAVREARRWTGLLATLGFAVAAALTLLE